MMGIYFFQLSACCTGSLMKGTDGMAHPAVAHAIVFIVPPIMVGNDSEKGECTLNSNVESKFSKKID